MGFGGGTRCRAQPNSCRAEPSSSAVPYVSPCRTSAGDQMDTTFHRPWEGRSCIRMSERRLWRSGEVWDAVAAHATRLRDGDAEIESQGPDRVDGKVSRARGANPRSTFHLTDRERSAAGPMHSGTTSTGPPRRRGGPRSWSYCSSAGWRNRRAAEWPGPRGRPRFYGYGTWEHLVQKVASWWVSSSRP